MTVDGPAPAPPLTLPSTVTARRTDSGLDVLSVTNAHGSAEVYLQGAHVTGWTPTGEDPVLWLSSASSFAPGVPIRGGIPLCFPWFGPRAGDPEAPSHGYARLVPWTLTAASDDDEGTVLTFRLAVPADHAVADFEGLQADYEVRVGRSLTVVLTVTCTGDTPVTFEEAQHTYLQVRDVESTTVSGLEDAGYHDKAAASPADARRPAAGVPLVPSGQVDRVYLGTTTPVSVDDGERTLVVTKTGSASTVVWSPGAEVAGRVADIAAGEWRQMVCVETCNVGDAALTLAPGESHSLGSTYTVSRDA